MPLILWGQRKFSRLPSLSDNRAHADSKISNLPDKIWRSKREIFVVAVVLIEKNAIPAERHLIFQG